MKSFTKYLLLLMTLAWSGWMFGQTSPAQTEEQKIALDNASMSTETAIVPFSTYADEPAASRALMAEIGNGTTYGTSPAYYADWSNYWENCHTQTLYLASEIGGGMLITDLQYVFERIATPDNYLLNVEIRFMETTDNQLTTGAFYSTAGSTLVWSSANYVPATATGWADLIDINDYVYTGVNNLIVDILWGDNGYYESPYYRTYRTDGGVPRVLVGYADSETPPNYDAASTYFSNIRFYGDPLTAPGDIEGHVYNTGGLSIGGATVGIDGYGSTTTDGTGYYLLTGMPSGDQELVCYRAGYNVNIANVNVASGGIITHDFTMTAPNLSVSPLRLDETLAPNEYLTRFIGMLNTGSGPVDWTAEVIYPITSQAVTNLEGGEDFTQMTRFDGKFGAGSFLPAAGPAMSDRGTMDCPDGAVFNNPPVGSDNGYTSDATVGYKVYQSFTGVPASISTVTFWTIFTAAPPATKDYLIEVYEAGATPGALLSTGTYTLTPVNTGVQVIGYDTYVFTAEIPSVAATDGWVMVQGLAGAPTNYWLNTYSGIGTALQSNGGAYTNVGSVGMCLSGGGAGNWLTLGEYDGTVNGGG
ncbi:MAG: carboxypeptidase-like regulatory domain-containing protein, partial [Bacteroidales bacterium]|nr:carboxypeptidase-like regulatory domain-containing protein [Bacteroidales bacterium]